MKSGIYNPPLVLSPVFYHIVRKKTRITECSAVSRAVILEAGKIADFLLYIASGDEQYKPTPDPKES